MKTGIFQNVSPLQIANGFETITKKEIPILLTFIDKLNQQRNMDSELLSLIDNNSFIKILKKILDLLEKKSYQILRSYANILLSNSLNLIEFAEECEIPLGFDPMTLEYTQGDFYSFFAEQNIGIDFMEAEIEYIENLEEDDDNLLFEIHIKTNNLIIDFIEKNKENKNAILLVVLNFLSHDLMETCANLNFILRHHE